MYRVAATAIAFATVLSGLIISAGPAHAWPSIIKTYPHTTAGWRQCQIDLKLAPPAYHCREIYSPLRYGLISG